jgi:hypothetical protein
LAGRARLSVRSTSAWLSFSPLTRSVRMRQMYLCIMCLLLMCVCGVAGSREGPFFDLECSGAWMYTMESCKDSALWNYVDELVRACLLAAGVGAEWRRQQQRWGC